MKTFAALLAALSLTVAMAEPVPVHEANMVIHHDNCTTSSSTYVVDPVTATPKPSIPAYGQAPPAYNPAPVYTPHGYGSPILSSYGTGSSSKWTSVQVTTYTASPINSASSRSTLGSPITAGNSTSSLGTAPASGFTPSFGSATRRGTAYSSTEGSPVTNSLPESSSTLTTTLTTHVISTITISTDASSSFPAYTAPTANWTYPAPPYATIISGGSIEGSPITGTAVSSGLPTYTNSTSTVEWTANVSLTETIYLTATKSYSATLSGSAPFSPVTAFSNSSTVVMSTISTRPAPYPYPSHPLPYGTGSFSIPSSGFQAGSSASSGFAISPVTASSRCSSGYLPSTGAPGPAAYGLPSISCSTSTTGYNSTELSPVGGTRTSSTLLPSSSVSSQSHLPGTGSPSSSSASPSSGFSTITTSTAGPVPPPSYGTAPPYPQPITSEYASPPAYTVYQSHGDGGGARGWFGGWFGKGADGW